MLFRSGSQTVGRKMNLGGSQKAVFPLDIGANLEDGISPQ